MSKKIKVDDLSKAIMTELKNYEGDTEEAAWNGVVETSQEAVQELRSAHPSGSGKYGSWEKYNKGWTVKRPKETKQQQSIMRQIISSHTFWRTDMHSGRVEGRRHSSISLR